MKDIHRLIVTSTTYRQSSRVTEQHRQLDMENRWLARGSRFRMPAMLLRDWALASSGLLETQLGGQPVYPYQPDAVWEPLAITKKKERDFTYPILIGTDLYRRSLYTFWRRTVGPANMFDASNRQACRVRISTTSTPLHALTTLNDPTWVEAAEEVLARRRCCRQTRNSMHNLRKPFAEWFVACPRTLIWDISKAYDRQLTIYRDDPDAARPLLNVGAAERIRHSIRSSMPRLPLFASGILNLDEALTRE